MTCEPLEAYLSRLRHELAKRRLADARIVEEVREHLVDAIDDGLQRGLPADAAAREAFVRFGTPEAVADQFAAESRGMLNQLRFVLGRLAGLIRRNEPPAVGYHFRDKPAPVRFQTTARLKWRARKKDVGPFEMDPREHLVQFLGTFGPRTLGADGTLESLTLLEDTTDSRTRGGRYLAAFASGARMIWTVGQAADGTISLDGTSAP
jgi:hypothetical protein